MASLDPLLETASLSPDDLLVADEQGVTAKRWTLQFTRRDVRHAHGWRKTEVKALSGEEVPFYVALGKSSKTVDGDRRQALGAGVAAVAAPDRMATTSGRWGG